MPAIMAIYLDVDEVLADWVGAALRVLGFDPAEVHERWSSLDPRPWDLFEVLDYDVGLAWTLIDEQGPEFWATLQPLPWAAELFAVCSEVAPVTLLTSPSKYPNSYAGKAMWVQRVFGEGFRDYALTCAKHRFAHPGAVLVDDSPKNCKAFVAAGGRAVLFPGLGNDLHHVVPGPSRVSHVLDALRELQS